MVCTCGHLMVLPCMALDGMPPYCEMCGKIFVVDGDSRVRVEDSAWHYELLLKCSMCSRALLRVLALTETPNLARYRHVRCPHCNGNLVVDDTVRRFTGPRVPTEPDD